LIERNSARSSLRPDLANSTFFLLHRLGEADETRSFGNVLEPR
jgi:hypothetical protein